MSANICAPLQALVAFEMNVISALNKKFAALRRLAELLEQLGDLSLLLPNLSQLLPVTAIDLEAYTQLQQACPFLGLPPASNTDLNALQSKLNAAYAQAAGKLLNHPWMRMDKVQKMLNDYQQKLNYPYGDSYVACLNAACNAVGAAGSLLEKASHANIAKELESFTNNFVTNGGEIMTKSMLVKRDNAQQVYNQLLDLRDDTIQDFQQPGAPQTPPLRVGHPTVPAYTFLPSQTFRALPAH